jgi:NAD(P)-dependent dehydrogenase (short-subunit alcohol dehydrogenase family)
MLDAGYEVVSLSLGKSERKHPRLHEIDIDLMDAVTTRQVAVELGARHTFSHFVHSAGAILPALLPDVKPGNLEALSQLHLGAAITLAQAILPSMKSKKFGRIVLISSRGALGLQTRTAYAATKAGMVGMARTWALELAADGITVNVIAPGPIAGTAMFHDVVPKDSEREQVLAANIPVKRLGRPEDVARAVMFFCGRENDFVTGQTLYVCGGASLGSLTI